MHPKSCVTIFHERFLTKFYYNSTENIFGENLFELFKIPTEIIVHKNLAERLYSIVPVLEHFNLNILFTDVFRPTEMQRFLHENWESRTGQKPKSSLADIETAPHARGIAFDCKLVDINGNPIPLPSSSIKFHSEERNPDYIFSDTAEDQEKKRNRNFLRYMMLCAGISPINKEWFHFQLPESDLYEPISIEEAQNVSPLSYESVTSEPTFYDIFHKYQNDEYEGKKHFWINRESYFKQFEKICLKEFISKLESIKNAKCTDVIF